jgi:hypothetical protein
VKLARDYIMNVIDVNKSVLFRSSRPTLTLLLSLEVPGESLQPPQLESIIGEVGGLIFFTLHSNREFSTQGEREGTACAVVNQLLEWLFQKSNEIFFFALTANFLVD